jgi:hypothetical protein
MTDEYRDGEDHSGASALWDPVSLGPLVDVLTRVLKADSDEQATTVVSGTSRELAILRAHLEPGPVSGGGHGQHAAESRASVDALLQQFRSDSDRLESEVTRQQDEIASLVAQLGRQVIADDRGARPQESQPQLDGSSSLADDQPAAAVPLLSASQSPNAPSSGGSPGNQQSTPILDATAPPVESHPARDHRGKWGGNVLVGAITLAVVLVVLAIIGAF